MQHATGGMWRAMCLTAMASMACDPAGDGVREAGAAGSVADDEARVEAPSEAPATAAEFMRRVASEFCTRVFECCPGGMPGLDFLTEATCVMAMSQLTYPFDAETYDPELALDCLMRLEESPMLCEGTSILRAPVTDRSCVLATGGRLAAGEDCLVIDDTCAAGLVCGIEGYCVEPRSEGESCGWDPDCGAGLVCRDGQCVEVTDPQPGGEPCERDLECASEACVEGRCEDLGLSCRPAP